MKVKLVSYSQPDQEFFLDTGMSTLSELVTYCARVSNPSNQMNTETADRLINYLMKHQHWSVFEMVNVCLEIDTTRDIAHQIVRHRSFSFQEFSQRYADPSSMEYPFELSECRLQDHKNRQNSIECTDAETIAWWIAQQKRVITVASNIYHEALERGIAKEVARKVLPEGLTKSRLYMNGTLRSWIHYCDLRGANGTQKEHMLVARECARVIHGLYPQMAVNSD